MRQFSFSEMNRQSGEILEAALNEPVSLTKYGRERLIIVSADRYRSLVGGAKQIAFTVADAPDDIHAELMTGLDAILAEDERDA